MGRKLVLFSLVVLVTAYYLQDTIPPGFTQEWKVRGYLSTWKLAFVLSQALVLLGFNEISILKGSARVIADLHTALETPDPDVVRRVEYLDGVKVFVYGPPYKAKPRRAIVFYHGGGFVIGEAAFFHDQMHRTSKHLNAVILFPDYRLAPEFPFPAAFDDCLAVFKYLVNNCNLYNIDPNRVAVMGDSAGGNLAAVISLHLMTHNFKPLPKLQVLQFPLLQAENLDTPSYRANKNGPFLSKGSMAFFYAAYFFGRDYKQYQHHIFAGNHTTKQVQLDNAKHPLNLDYLPDDAFKHGYQATYTDGSEEIWQKIRVGARDPRFTPFYTKDLSGLPPAYVTTCQYDVLRDDGFYYVHMMRKQKVKVHHVNLEVCFHGWPLLHRYVDTLDREYDKMMDFIDVEL